MNFRWSPMFASSPLRSRRQRGVSIVEMMIGMVIALLVGLVAASSARLFSASQRQSIGAAGASMSATSAVAAIKENIAQAGLGFLSDAAFLCPSLNFSVDAANLSMAAFSPLRVTRTGNLDQVDVFYADQVASGANVIADSITGVSSVELRSFLPVDAVNLGQAVLLSPPPDSIGVVPCTVRSVTGVTASTDTTPQILSFVAAGVGSRHNQVNFGAVPAYPLTSRVTLLGNLDWRRYRVLNGNLVMERPLVAADTPAVLVRNVVAFRVQYGVVGPNNGDMTFTGWQEPAGAWSPLTAANVSRLRAVRIGLLMRSEQPEKPESNGSCTASPNVPRLIDTDIAVADVGAISWQCYRYPSVTTIVPLRNWAMGMRAMPPTP
jgi:type IV pilus assembly protein PilW